MLSRTRNNSKKKEENETVDELLDRFTMEMSRFKQHVFNIENQSQYYHELKTHSSSNEVLIHADFSANYECKLAREIVGLNRYIEISIRTDSYLLW